MQREIREGSEVKAEIRQYFQAMKNENKLVDVMSSAKKLAKLVLMEKYTSGR